MNSCGGVEDSRVEFSSLPGLERQAMGVDVGVAVEGANVGSGVRVEVAVAGTIVEVGSAWVVEQAERKERNAKGIAIRFIA